jgi:hypothetical protein
MPDIMPIRPVVGRAQPNLPGSEFRVAVRFIDRAPLAGGRAVPGE